MVNQKKEDWGKKLQKEPVENRPVKTGASPQQIKRPPAEMPAAKPHPMKKPHSAPSGFSKMQESAGMPTEIPMMSGMQMQAAPGGFPGLMTAGPPQYMEPRSYPEYDLQASRQGTFIMPQPPPQVPMIEMSRPDLGPPPNLSREMMLDRISRLLPLGPTDQPNQWPLVPMTPMVRR